MDARIYTSFYARSGGGMRMTRETLVLQYYFLSFQNKGEHFNLLIIWFVLFVLARKYQSWLNFSICFFFTS